VVSVIRADFAATSFQIDQFGSSIIASALLCNVVLMFVVRGGMFAKLGTEFPLSANKQLTTNQTMFFHRVVLNGLLNCC